MTIRDAERTLDSSPDLGVLTIKEFAAMFRMSRGMAYKLKRAGQLKCSKLGNRTVVTLAEAKRFQDALPAAPRDSKTAA